VEIVKEVEVVKSIDMNSLRAMMEKMGTVEISKQVIGETRTKKDAKVISRRELDSSRDTAKSTSKSEGKSIKAPRKSKIKVSAKRGSAKKSSPKAGTTNRGAKKSSAKGSAKNQSTKKSSTRITNKKRVKKDDLRKIEGIGPKISGLLVEAGIDTFAKLAKAKITKLKSILEKAGPRYQMHNPGTWPKQSKLAASDKWDELTKLQDKLSGGK